LRSSIGQAELSLKVAQPQIQTAAEHASRKNPLAFFPGLKYNPMVTHSAPVAPWLVEPMNDVSARCRLFLLHASCAVLALAALTAPVSTACAQGTAFSYQGRLNVNGAPANGGYDLTFALFNSSNGVGQVASTLTNLNTGVTNGLFAVTLDFGPGVFTGANVWLQIGVRTNGATAFTPLAPLQSVLPLPYAIMANTASNLLGTLPAAQLSGTIPAAQLPAAVLTNGATRVTLTGTFSGNGAGLTGTQAGSLNASASNIVNAITLANNLYGKEAYMSWALATNGPWPTDWISTSGNHFEIPVNNINQDVVTNGTFEIPTGVITTDGFGNTNAGGSEQTVVACVDAPPYDAIGADLYYDTLSGTNWPSYLFTMVSSTNVMVQNDLESTSGWFLHMHVWITGLAAGSQAGIFSEIQFVTNFPYMYADYLTNIYVPNPLVYTFGGNTLHNIEIRHPQPTMLQVVVDGTTTLQVVDPNIPYFWGNGTAWWEIACGGNGTGPPTADTARIRILDCYTRGLPSPPVNLYPLVIGSGLPASVEVSSANNTGSIGMTNGQNALTFSAGTNSVSGPVTVLNSIALGNGGILVSNVYRPDTNTIVGSGFVYFPGANRTFTNAFNDSYIANGGITSLMLTNWGIYYVVTNTANGRGAYNTNGFTSVSWFTNGLAVPGVMAYAVLTNQYVFIPSNAAPYPSSLTNLFRLNVSVSNSYNVRLQTWINYGFPSSTAIMLYTNLTRGDSLTFAGSNTTNVFDFVMSPGDVTEVTNLAGSPVIFNSFSIPQ
jgi:hypothetical protein